jgi:hypothetical protein
MICRNKNTNIILLVSLAKRWEGGSDFGLCPNSEPLPTLFFERSEHDIILQ